jgi:hypothetical protein
MTTLRVPYVGAAVAVIPNAVRNLEQIKKNIFAAQINY